MRLCAARYAKTALAKHRRFDDSRGVAIHKRRAQVNFDPKKLLASILQIYLNAHDADRAGAFAAAVAADGRSYRPQNFSEALRIATELGLPGFSANHCSKLKALAAAVQREKADEEARLYCVARLRCCLARPRCDLSGNSGLSVLHRRHQCTRTHGISPSCASPASQLVHTYGMQRNAQCNPPAGDATHKN